MATAKKMVKLSEETHRELNKLGIRNESFDSIVQRLIVFYKKNSEKK